MRADAAVGLILIPGAYTAIVYALLGVRTTDLDARLFGCAIATVVAARLGVVMFQAAEET